MTASIDSNPPTPDPSAGDEPVPEDELEQFLYLASHDLQEPLRKIIGYSELLENDVENGNDERVEEDLHYITRSAQRMQDMIDALLTMSRIGREPPDREPVDPHTCVDAAMNNLELRINQKQPEVTIDDLPRVRAQQDQLTLVFQNLIENGLKYSEEAPHQIHVTGQLDEERGTAVLGVMDNGIGIDDQYRDRVFAPFKRLHDTASHEGEGIGLAIVHKVIRQWDGRVWIEDGDDGGTHIRFQLEAVPHG